MTELGQALRRLPRDRRTAFLLMALAVPLHVGADQWYFEPRASLDTFYDTNVRLLSEDATPSPGVKARVHLKGGERTETSDVALDASVVAWRYADAPAYDSNDLFIDLTAVHKRERDRFALNGRIDYDSTATSELETSGRVQANKRRERLYVAPSWVHLLSERATVEARASYTDVGYEDAGPLTGLTDYTYVTGGLVGTYLLGETTSATTRLSFDRYDASTIPSTVDSVGISVGVRRAFSETLSGWAELGARYSESTYLSAAGNMTGQTDTGPIAELGLDWRGETTSVLASLRRALVPSGNGELLDTTRTSLSVREDLSPRWSVLASLSAVRNRDDTGGPEKSEDRDYVSFEPSVRYRLTEWWELRGSYRYRSQAYEPSGRSADSHAVFLSISYTWPREPVAQWSELE
jgi:hypothetical protein